MIAGNRNLLEGRRPQASRKICSGRPRHSKLYRRLQYHNPLSRENVDGLGSKLRITPRGHSVTHVEKLSAVCKMVLALPHILLRAP
jgi:hypothetical protein